MAECSCRGANPDCFKCGGWGRIGDDIGNHRGGLSTLPVSAASGKWKADKNNSPTGTEHLLGITYPDSGSYRRSSSLTFGKRRNKKTTQTKEERRIIRKSEFKQRIQTNLDKNIQRHSKATEALQRVSDQTSPWLRETEQKIREIKKWIQTIEQWIKEDEKKLKVKNSYLIGPNGNKSGKKRK